MVFTCDNCHFIFDAENYLDQCPDCGKYAVRRATEEEVKELEEREKLQEN